MTKEVFAHKDIIGNGIKVGDTVVYPNHNKLTVAIVEKVNPKMITVKGVGRYWTDRKYPTDLLVVDDPKITLYFMKHGS